MCSSSTGQLTRVRLPTSKSALAWRVVFAGDRRVAPVWEGDAFVWLSLAHLDVGRRYEPVSVQGAEIQGVAPLKNGEDDGTLVGLTFDAESSTPSPGWWSTTEQRAPASWDHGGDSGPGEEIIVQGSRLILPCAQAELAIPVEAADWFDALCRIQNRPYTPAGTKALPGGVPSGAPCGG